MGFTRHVVLTYAVRLVLLPVGLVYSVVVARWLGVSRLGTFAAIGAILGMVSQVGNLGLSIAATRFAARDEREVPPLLANARVAGVVLGLAAIAVLAALYEWLPSIFGEVPSSLLLLAAAALPLTFASAQFQAVLLGRTRIRQYNFMEALDRLLLLSGAALVLVVLGLDLRALVAVTVGIAVVEFVIYHVLLWPESSRLAPDPALARRMRGFSARAYLGTLLAYLVLRSDMLLINAMLGSEETGLYAVAVRPIDFLLVLPAVAGTMLFPRIAAAGDRASAHLTAMVARHTALILGICIAALGAGAWWAVPLLFGDVYRAAVYPLWILLPGVWCMAVQSILGNDLSGRDYPVASLIIWSALLLTNVGLNLWWIPWLGIAGAAASSTVAYGLSLALMGRYWLKRFPEIRVSELFVLSPEELRSLGVRLKHTLWPASEREPPSSSESR